MPLALIQQLGCDQRGCHHGGHTVKNGKSAGPVAVVGVSHSTASLDLRSRLSIGVDERSRFLRRIKDLGIEECAVLSTCNRTEVYFAGGSTASVVELLAGHARLDAEELWSHLYEKHCVCAACHLFRVTSGLDSAVLGETEIVAQVKEAWRAAELAGTSGPSLALVFRRALEASKRVRTETDVARTVTSTATLAVKVAANRLSDLSRTQVLVMGAGPIAERLLKELRAEGIRNATILNRTPANAERIAEPGETVTGMDRLRQTLTQADVVFAALGGGGGIVDAATIDTWRRGRPLLVLDMGVPPNVDGAADSVDRVTVDDLSRECEANLDARMAAVPAALNIIEQEIARFTEALAQREAAPTIRALVRHGDQIRKQNLEWAKGRLTNLTEKEMRVVEEMARRMMIGLLEAPIEGLKGELSAQQHRHIVERLFALEGSGDA